MTYWRVVNVEVRLLDTFAVVSLRIRQTEEAFLEKVAIRRVRPWSTRRDQWSPANLLLLVPEGKGNVLQPMGIRDSRDTILSPSICARPSVLVREVLGCGVSGRHSRPSGDCPGQEWENQRLQASPLAL